MAERVPKRPWWEQVLTNVTLRIPRARSPAGQHQQYQEYRAEPGYPSSECGTIKEASHSIYSGISIATPGSEFKKLELSNVSVNFRKVCVFPW